MKTISILGSTGSIGKSVLEVISHYSEGFRVIGLTTRKNFQIIQRQIKKYNPKIVGIVDPVIAEKVKKNFPSLNIEVGEEGIVKVAKEKVDILVVAIVGIAALKPTLAAIQHNHTIALANKEIIVASGKLLMEEVKKREIQILPLDSEPCAIFQIYKNIKRDDVKRVIITASGGPFYNLNEKKLWEVTPEMALKHPVWQMGQKITIDSATLMNKGFEIITIHWLFDLQMEKIQVVIHPEAKIHAMVELKDGFTFSLLSPPDMKYVINYLLHYPTRTPYPFPTPSLEIESLHFYPPDEKKFPALKLCREAERKGGTTPAVLNACNEVAVEAFLQRKIRFPQIWKLCQEVVKKHTPEPLSWEGMWKADAWAREECRKLVVDYEKDRSYS